MAHGFEQDFANVVHPASVNAPGARHESPAPQSESELHRVPADRSGELHVARGTSSAKSKGTRRALRIVVILAPVCAIDYWRMRRDRPDHRDRIVHGTKLAAPTYRLLLRSRARASFVSWGLAA
jgi:hypothetical protein